MDLTPLERAALIAIAQASPNGVAVRTALIKFEPGYSKFAGALSSLRRKGVVICEGERPHRGSLAKDSQRTVMLTPDGWAEYRKMTMAPLWSVENDRYIVYDGKLLFVTRHMGEGFDGSERPMSELTAIIVRLLNQAQITYPPVEF